MKKIKVANSIEWLLLVLSLIAIIICLMYDVNKYIIYSLFVLVGFLLGALILSAVNQKRQKQIEWLENKVKLTNSIAYKIKLAGEKAFTEIPLGIIVYDNYNTINWANKYATNIFCSPLIDRKLSNIDDDFEIKVKTLPNFKLTVYEHEYEVTVLKEQKIMFLKDRTELHNLEHKYDNRTQAAGLISLDNFDEALSTYDAQTRAMKLSDIIGILSDWCQKFGIYIRGYTEKQYLIIMTKEQLALVMQEQFDVVDSINQYCNNQNLKISISIGVACFDGPITDLMEKTNEMLERALNRGGNQVTVFFDGKIKYFGGKEIGNEIRFPFYARIKAEDLCSLIDKSSDVLIMAHNNTDTDALGASIGLYKICMNLNKPCKIVLDEEICDETVKNILRDINSNFITMKDYFTTSQKALNDITNDTLLILVDIQFESNLICPKLYRKARRVAIIDHHRSGNKAISNYLYLYSRTSSSSSVELIVEMFDYIEGNISITSKEASLMLLGILVDTNNLLYRTTAQTFAVISKLQTLGASIPEAQGYLRETEEIYKKRISVLNNINIIDDIFGICLCDNNIYTRPFIAKVADNILSVNTIKAGFCIGKIDDNIIGVSARALDYNVQLVMEELGGGGHFNNAAAQLKNTTIEEVEQKLISILRKDKNEKKEDMKIILIKDVKGKGKEGDIIDIPSGHANYLIKSKSAIVASPDNINEWKKRSEKEKIDAQNHLEEMRTLKATLEANHITIFVKVGREGRLFGSVSDKQIVEAIKETYNVTIDKHKILYDKPIAATGTYTIPIQLHKEVICNLTLYVQERKG